MQDMGMAEEDKEEMNSLPSSFDDFSEEEQQEVGEGSGKEGGEEGTRTAEAGGPSGSNPNLFYNDYDGDDAGTNGTTEQQQSEKDDNHNHDSEAEANPTTKANGKTSHVSTLENQDDAVSKVQLDELSSSPSPEKNPDSVVKISPFIATKLKLRLSENRKRLAARLQQKEEEEIGNGIGMMTIADEIADQEAMDDPNATDQAIPMGLDLDLDQLDSEEQHQLHYKQHEDPMIHINSRPQLTDKSAKHRITKLRKLHDSARQQKMKMNHHAAFREYEKEYSHLVIGGVPPSSMGVTEKHQHVKPHVPLPSVFDTDNRSLYLKDAQLFPDQRFVGKDWLDEVEPGRPMGQLKERKWPKYGDKSGKDRKEGGGENNDDNDDPKEEDSEGEEEYNIFDNDESMSKELLPDDDDGSKYGHGSYHPEDYLDEIGYSPLRNSLK